MNVRGLAVIVLLLSVFSTATADCVKIIQPLMLKNINGTLVPTLIIKVEKCSKKR